MFKITISIQCDQCANCHDISVLSNTIDAMAWQTDAWTLMTDAEGVGWDFFRGARCAYCSGASGEIFRDHPGDFYGELVHTADGTPF
jgi:hypothetical protein